MSARPILFLAIATLLALVAVCVRNRASAIEEQLHARAQAALADAGLADAGLSIEGRDAILAGTVAFDEIRSEAVARVAAIDGVRSVRDQLSIASSPLFKLEPDADLVFLRGKLPSAESREALFRAAAAAYGRGDVVDEIEIDPATTHPDWLEALPEILRLTAAEGRSVSFSVESTGFLLRGRLRSELRHDLLAERIARLAPEVPLDDQIRVDPAPRAVLAQQQVDEVLERTRIEFAPGSAEITASGLEVIDELRRILSRHPETSIEIIGHTDSQGNPETNLSLSRERAEAVRQQVASTIDIARILAGGYGAQRPIADNESSEGRQRNRRIELRIFQGS